MASWLSKGHRASVKMISLSSFSLELIFGGPVIACQMALSPRCLIVGLMEAVYSSIFAVLKWKIASVNVTIGDLATADCSPASNEGY